MKLNYIISDDPAHRLTVLADSVAKTAKLQYYKNNLLQQERSMDIAPVVDFEPTTPPKFQVSKRGFIWDLHIFKTGADNSDVRLMLSITTPTTLVATKVEMINDGTTDVTLKDYISQPLDVYSSRLTLSEKTFSTTDGLIGVSGNTSVVPVVTPDGLLELGRNSNIGIPLAAPINLNTEGFTMVLSVASLGENTSLGDYQLGIKLGTNGKNIIKFDANKGVLFTGSGAEVTVFPPTAWASKIDVMLEYADGVPRLFVNGSMATLSSFVNTDSVDSFILTSMCDDNKTTRVDYFLAQKLKG